MCEKLRSAKHQSHYFRVTPLVAYGLAWGRKRDGVSVVTQPFPSKTQENVKHALVGNLSSVRAVFIWGSAWKVSLLLYA